MIDDEKFFDAVFLQDAFGFVKRGADRNGDQIFLGHHRVDQLGVIFFKAQIAVGENSREARTASHGQAGDAVLRP